MWSLRASDIYQGGETEPLQSDGAVPAAFQSLDSESPKNYPHVVALDVRAHLNSANFPMTVLSLSPKLSPATLTRMDRLSSAPIRGRGD